MQIITANLEGNQLFNHIFEHSQMGMCILALDGRIIKMNPAALSFFGYTMDELSNRFFLELTQTDELERCKMYFDELVSGDRQSYEIEKKYQHKDGSLLWARVKVTMTPIEGNQVVTVQIIDLTEEKRIETQYKESEAHYQLLVNHALDLICMITYEGTLRYVSPASESILGYLPNDMLGKDGQHFIHPDDLPKIQLFFENVLGIVGNGTITHRAFHKKGRIVWLESTLIRLPNKDGMGTIYVWSRDVTRRKREQKRLKESEERYQSLYRYHPDMVYSMDLEGRFTSINLACETLTGYSKEQLLHSSLSYHCLVDQRDHDYVKQRFEETVNGKVQRYECRIHIKNGQPLIIDVTNIPILVDGEVVGVFGVARNISKRRYAEVAIKTMHDQMEAFINNHSDSILIFNSNDELVKVNKTFDQIYGWDGQSLIGKNVRELEAIPREEIPDVIKRIDVLRKGESVGHRETVRLRTDGTAVPTIVTSFPIINEEGKANGWASAFRDISDQKRAESIMINSEKLSVAGQLAAGIAHEIRNPLTAVKGFIQLLKSSMNTSDTSDTSGYYEIVTSEIERIEGIVSELLILAKPQKVVYTTVELGSLIEDVVQLLFSQAILNNVQLIFHAPPRQCMIHCEVNQIKQVFINFIKNGIEAMPDGGDLSIRVLVEEEDYYRVQFKDEGVGIPEEFISKLGQPFYTTKEKGTGLGFMVSKKIIEDHNGSLHVTSETNQGTLIEVTLPFKK